MGGAATRVGSSSRRPVPVGDLLAAAGLVTAALFTTFAAQQYVEAAQNAERSAVTVLEVEKPPLGLEEQPAAVIRGESARGGLYPAFTIFLPEADPTPAVLPEPAPAPVAPEPVAVEPAAPPVDAVVPQVAPVVAAPPPPQLPAQVEGVPGSRPAEVGVAALEGIEYPWEALGYTIRFLDGRSGLYGMTYPWDKVIEIYVRDDMGVQEVRVVLAHEIGHAVDAEWMSGQEQYDYRLARGMDPKVEWYGCSGCSDFQTPAGDYAETFAWYLLGPGPFKSQVAGPPSSAEMAELERFYQPG